MVRKTGQTVLVKFAVKKYIKMIHKKGLVLVTLVKLVIAVALIVTFSWLIFRLTAQPETQTISSFKTLVSEVKLLEKDLDERDNVEIVVPIFIDTDWIIRAIDKSFEKIPPNCKKQSCLALSKGLDLMATTNVARFKNVEFKEQSEYIRTLSAKIIKVKIIGEKQGDKKIISIEPISE